RTSRYDRFFCTTPAKPKDEIRRIREIALAAMTLTLRCRPGCRNWAHPQEGAPASCSRRPVGLQERLQMADGQRNAIFRFLPWEKRHLRVRREHGRFLCHG